MNNSLTPIGLEAGPSASLAQELNALLAHYQVLYQNVRGFHWNIQGEKFFELHLKFEELYGNLQLKIDEIAERILTLGGQPLHTFADYLRLSGISPVADVREGRKAMESILQSLHALLVVQRRILILSAEAGDEGTNALMSDYLREQEKLSWMYRAWLG